MEDIRAGASLDIVDELPPDSLAPEKVRHRKEENARSGDLVAVKWGQNDQHADWNSSVPGHVDMTPAHLLANDKEYADLAGLGETPIPTVWLNLDYHQLKEYERARTKTLTDAGVDSARDRYAVGVGVGMLEAYQHTEKLKRATGGLAPEAESEIAITAARVAGQAALAMMPEYDALLRAAGLAKRE